MRALVTGAGKRLGRAMALYLAGRGYDVAVHYASSKDDADVVVAAITALGRAAVAPRGHMFGWRAAAASLSLAAYRDEQWHGVAQLRFLGELARRFETDAATSSTSSPSSRTRSRTR